MCWDSVHMRSACSEPNTALKNTAYITLTATPIAAVMSIISPFISYFMWIVLWTASYRRNPISIYTSSTLIIADRTSGRKNKINIFVEWLLYFIHTKYCAVSNLHLLPSKEIKALYYFCHVIFLI